MKIQIRQPQWFTEIGRKDNQEDYLWPNPDSVDTRQRVFIMCDGVGGQDSGEVASQTAATALGTYLTEHPAKDGVVTKSMFEEALAYAYDELDKVDTGAFKKMGTTMTCLVLHNGGALVAHIGDSRIYQVRPSLATEGRTGIIYQSADHSLVNDLLRAGEITEEEAVNFPQKNVITRAMQPNLERRYKADIYNLDDVQAGDYFFLCCDGVLEQLTNDKLGAILADASLSDKEKRDAIFDICNGMTRDNYTCWLVPIDRVEREETDVVFGRDEVVAAVEVEEPTQAPAMEQNANHDVKCKTENTGSSIRKYVFGALAVCLLVALGWTAKGMLTNNDSKCQEANDSTTQKAGFVIGEQKANVKKTVSKQSNKPSSSQENAEDSTVEAVEHQQEGTGPVNTKDSVTNDNKEEITPIGENASQDSLTGKTPKTSKVNSATLNGGFLNKFKQITDKNADGK